MVGVWVGNFGWSTFDLHDLSSGDWDLADGGDFDGN